MSDTIEEELEEETTEEHEVEEVYEDTEEQNEEEDEEGNEGETEEPYSNCKRKASPSSSGQASTKKVAVSRISPRKSPTKTGTVEAVSSEGVFKTELMSYVMIEVPADGKRGSEKSIYLVPKMVVKPNHTLVSANDLLAVGAPENENDEVEMVDEAPEPTASRDVDAPLITALSHFKTHRSALILPPTWSMTLFPTFVAFMQAMPHSDLISPLTAWFSKCICLGTDMKPILKIHDVTVSTALLRPLEQPFTESELYELLEGLTSAEYCPGLGMSDRVVAAAVQGVVIPFKAEGCAVLVDRRALRSPARCPACSRLRLEVLRQLNAAK
ncbi:hypothetical protein BV898_05299 [Hypsibius exemplaris]|uniref:Uncharacterized protein n=1 Tax=Hypsibius exemplaris TaxID=2072580 RepID=A0A1W0WZR3_HYPEX|nr:hypothetical protein BV898_05299 [Hypsibius exemplaris]